MEQLDDSYRLVHQSEDDLFTLYSLNQDRWITFNSKKLKWGWTKKIDPISSLVPEEGIDVLLEEAKSDHVLTPHRYNTILLVPVHVELKEYDSDRHSATITDTSITLNHKLSVFLNDYLDSLSPWDNEYDL